MNFWSVVWHLTVVPYITCLYAKGVEFMILALVSSRLCSWATGTHSRWQLWPALYQAWGFMLWAPGAFFMASSLSGYRLPAALSPAHCAHSPFPWLRISPPGFTPMPHRHTPRLIYSLLWPWREAQTWARQLAKGAPLASPQGTSATAVFPQRQRYQAHTHVFHSRGNLADQSTPIEAEWS